MARNIFTRLGRPPAPKVYTQPKQPMTGERQGRAPSDGLDTAIPARAFKRGGHLPKYHDDPAFCSGGPTKRR